MLFLVKLILSFFSGEPNVPLISKVGPSSNIRELLLRLSEWDDKLLSTPNTYPYPLYKYFSPSLFFTILLAPNK